MVINGNLVTYGRKVRYTPTSPKPEPRPVIVFPRQPCATCGWHLGAWERMCIAGISKGGE